MKTLEELKQEMDIARAAWDAWGADDDAAWDAAWGAYLVAQDAYDKKLKEMADEDA